MGKVNYQVKFSSQRNQQIIGSFFKIFRQKFACADCKVGLMFRWGRDEKQQYINQATKHMPLHTLLGSVYF